MKTRWLFFSLVFLGILLVLGMIIADQLTDEADQPDKNAVSPPSLKQILNDARCSNPCWLGIEIGVTSEQAAVDILEQNSIKYSIAEPPSGQHIYNFSLEDTSSWWNSSETQGGSLISWEGTVVWLGLPLNACISTIVNTYGEPTVESPDDDSFYYFLYPGYGLDFWVDPETSRSSSVVLRSKELTEQLVSEIVNPQGWEMYLDEFSDDCEDDFSS